MKPGKTRLPAVFSRANIVEQWQAAVVWDGACQPRRCWEMTHGVFSVGPPVQPRLHLWAAHLGCGRRKRHAERSLKINLVFCRFCSSFLGRVCLILWNFICAPLCNYWGPELVTRAGLRGRCRCTHYVPSVRQRYLRQAKSFGRRFSLYLERGFWSPKAVSGNRQCRDINHASDWADLGLGTKPGLWGEVPQVKPLLGRGSPRLCGPFESTRKNILSCQAHAEGGGVRTLPAPNH